MKNISRFLVALCCSALFLFSCENEIESEIQSSSEELVTSAETKALSVDSLEPLKMTDELKALKERMDELRKQRLERLPVITANIFLRTCGLFGKCLLH
jgi:Tfp pilus assembly protein PilO